MNKQNKNRKGQATLEEMVKSGSQLILMHDDGTEQPIEEIVQADPYAGCSKSQYACVFDRRIRYRQRNHRPDNPRQKPAT
jgi:hypothetical protein